MEREQHLNDIWVLIIYRTASRNSECRDTAIANHARLDCAAHGSYSSPTRTLDLRRLGRLVFVMRDIGLGGELIHSSYWVGNTSKVQLLASL